MRQALTGETERLEYIHSMLGQLRRMAGDERHQMLAYLIEMAWMEANDALRQSRSSRMRGDGSDKGDSAA